MATNSGLGSIENPVRFQDQDFAKLSEACLKSGQLFSDPAFPAEHRSIGIPEDPDPEKAIKWLRPKVGSPVRTPTWSGPEQCVVLAGGYGKGEFSHFRLKGDSVRNV